MGSDGGLSGCDFCEMYGTHSQVISTLARMNRKPEGKRSGLWRHNVQQSFTCGQLEKVRLDHGHELLGESSEYGEVNCEACLQVGSPAPGDIPDDE